MWGSLSEIGKTAASRPPAVGKADPKQMPADDILGHKRGNRPDIGAYQADGDKQPTTRGDAK